MEFVGSGGMLKTLESSVDGRWMGLQWRIQDLPQERANSQSGCANLLICIFCWKLHENEIIWTPKKARVPGAPLDPPMDWYWYFSLWFYEAHRGSANNSSGSRISQRERQLLNGERQPIILQIFFQKLHETEKIWTGARIPSSPLGSATEQWSLIRKTKSKNFDRWSLRSLTILRNHNLQFFRTRF